MGDDEFDMTYEFFFFKNFEKRAEVFDKVIFLKNISFFVRFSTFAKQARVFLNFFGQ